MIDEALRRCDIEEGKGISFVQPDDLKKLLCQTSVLFCRSLQSLPQRTASFQGAAPPLAMCPAVSQTLFLGAPSSQVHQAAPLKPGGDSYRGEPGKIHLHVSGTQLELNES